MHLIYELYELFFKSADFFLSINENAKKALPRLGIKLLRDLLFYKPSSYSVIDINPDLRQVRDGQLIQVSVMIKDILKPLSDRSPLRIRVANETGSINLVFFNQLHPYILSKLNFNQTYKIVGRVESFDGNLQMTHPDFIFKQNLETRLLPNYPLTYGIVNRQLYSYIRETISMFELMLRDNKDLAQSHPEQYKYVENLIFAIKFLHLVDVKDSDDFKRNFYDNIKSLASEELCANQVSLARVKSQEHQPRGRKFSLKKLLQLEILSKLGFSLTRDQKKVIKEIETDQSSDFQMMRMLQGDVGSGKTLVSLLTMVNVVKSGAQTVLMAPTDLLSTQHYQFFSKALEDTGIKIELLTGKTPIKKRRQLQQELKDGLIDILIGTHALFQENVEFKDLGYIVIDEQHKFGVKQRMELIQKASHPDVLVMTATPIPRSLTLTMFGDMSVSQIKNKPSNRLPIITSVLSENKRLEVLNSFGKKLAEGEKIYWVCPLVDQSDKLLKELVDGERQINSDEIVFADVVTRFAEINGLYPGQVGMVHGKMKAADKDLVMQDFKSGKLRILVATTVIEVGIDVSDCNLIIIENAEKFGLASLHQLRGRVGRGNQQAYCILIYNPRRISELGKERLNIMKKSNDGFYIAEQDLKLRGSGDVLGTKQSGVPEFFFADLKNDLEILLKMNKMAQHLEIDEFVEFKIKLFTKESIDLDKRNIVKSG